MWEEIEGEFRGLCAGEGRSGLIAAVPVARVRLLPEQQEHLRATLAPLEAPGEPLTALSMGIAYRSEEIEAVPGGWVSARPPESRWGDYVEAYNELNRCLGRVAGSMAERFGGVAEVPTRNALAGEVSHVSQCFPLCVSHRAFAEASGLGWRGRHGLVVTPEFGPALRLVTVFVPQKLEGPERQPGGCGECAACLEVCPVLRDGLQVADLNVYREMCRRRIRTLALGADVCGICVRRCWEVVTRRSS